MYLVDLTGSEQCTWLPLYIRIYRGRAFVNQLSEHVNYKHCKEDTVPCTYTYNRPKYRKIHRFDCHTDVKLYCNELQTPRNKSLLEVLRNVKDAKKSQRMFNFMRKRLSKKLITKFVAWIRTRHACENKNYMHLPTQTTNILAKY